MTTNQETLGKLRFFNFVQWCPSYPTIRTGPFKKNRPGFFFPIPVPLASFFFKNLFFTFLPDTSIQPNFQQNLSGFKFFPGLPNHYPGPPVLVRLYRIFRSRTDAFFSGFPVLEHPSTLVGKPFDPEQTSKPRYKNLGPSQ